MNIKFYKSCYDLAALSTCALKNEENKVWWNNAVGRIVFSDNFFAVTKYTVSCSDHFSADEYEKHEFEINFIKDEKLIETLRFKKVLDRRNLGSLANPKLSMQETIDAIKEYRPSFSDKVENMFKQTKLTKYEVDMIIEKNKKMFESLTKDQSKKPVKK